MSLRNCRVMYNEALGPDYFKMGLETGYDADRVFPGQFVMIEVGGLTGTILRRPFSISRVFGRNLKSQNIEVLYRVVGAGTRKLSETMSNTFVSILGPLGKGFSIPSEKASVYLVGGGIGLAPLIFLAERLTAAGIKKENMEVFFGAGSEPDAVLLKNLNTVQAEIHTATEDGSLGQKGLITELVETRIKTSPPDLICACGPVGMLKKIGELAIRFRIPCQVSLETVMACGMGACLGCAVKNSLSSDRYAHVCVDGPVFDLEHFRF